MGSAGDSPAPVGDPPTEMKERMKAEENLLNRRERSLFFFVGLLCSGVATNLERGLQPEARAPERGVHSVHAASVLVSESQ